MKKNAPFTNEQFRVIKKSFSLLAKKHGVTYQYVRVIALGERPAESKKARAILNDLKNIYQTLSPIVA